MRKLIITGAVLLVTPLLFNNPTQSAELENLGCVNSDVFTNICTAAPAELLDYAAPEVKYPVYVLGGSEAIKAKTTYPKVLYNSGIRARISMQFVVERDGSASAIELSEAYGNWSENPAHKQREIDFFVASARKTIGELNFDPARLASKEPVRVQIVLPIQFEIHPLPEPRFAVPWPRLNQGGPTADGC